MNQTPNNPRMNFVNRLLAGNPQLRNNPMAHNALSAIQNGDDATGEQIARNLCESYMEKWLRDPDEFEREMRDDHGEFPLRRRGEFEHEGRQYGKPYGEYLEARKHYTESHTAMDKAEMERRASEHLTSAMSTIRTIYGDADPDLRKKIKADFTKLVADMPA